MMLLTEKPAWKALETHRDAMKSVHMNALFTEDPGRFEKFHVRENGMLLDYSRHLVTAETRDLLIALAESCAVEDWRDRMFAGDKINTSEGRAVLHTALRRPVTDKVTLDGENIMP
ncbi:MAG: glucose-6-phosphate isomerase, partial [Alphaproteobacteria bacterium]|nr:glucose-6-phosphate isomerase [Alphaproteobacteria bacterium]